MSDFFLRKVSTSFRGGYIALTRQFIEHLPIRLLNLSNAAEDAQHDAIVSLVEQVLAAKQADPAADTQALESEIDTHVFRLYALTPAEIDLVKSSTAKPIAS